MTNQRELLGWGSETKQFRRTLVVSVGALAALSLAVGLWRKRSSNDLGELAGM
jgi:hypothetical protein